MLNELPMSLESKRSTEELETLGDSKGLECVATGWYQRPFSGRQVTDLQERNSAKRSCLTSVNHVNQGHLSEESYTDEDLNNKSTDKFVTISHIPVELCVCGTEEISLFWLMSPWLHFRVKHLIFFCFSRLVILSTKSSVSNMYQYITWKKVKTIGWPWIAV